MTIHTVTHSCGHTQEHDLRGNLASQASQRQYRERRVCKKCYAKSVQSQVRMTAGILRQPLTWVITVHNCFEIKEQLKSRGYRYHSFDKSWSHNDLPADNNDLSNNLERIIAEAEYLMSLDVVIDKDFWDCYLPGYVEAAHKSNISAGISQEESLDKLAPAIDIVKAAMAKYRPNNQ